MAREIQVREKEGLRETSFKNRKRQIEQEKRKEAQEIEKSKKEAKKSIFSEFYQINKKNSSVLRECLDINPTALKLLLFLFDNMDKYNAVMCSYAVFQESLNMSKPTITRCIRYLKDNGLIYVFRSGTSNVYVANPDVVWNSWGYNKKYCKFPANIILAKSEQIPLEYATQKEISIKKKEENHDY